MKLFYKQYGETGEPIFILHGIFGMLDNWHNIARQLSAHFQVFTIDARNHGQSPHSPEMSYALMAEDVFELADDLGFDTFNLMGHSMGGKTAMLCALMHPERIKRLAVVDIAPKGYKPGHEAYFNAFEDINWSVLQNRKEIDEALMEYESDSGVRLFLAKNIERRDEGGFAVKSNIHAIKNAYQGIIGEFAISGMYSGPCIFILGANSKYLKEDDKSMVQEHFPNVDYVSIPNAGHWVHADNPAAFLEALNLFLG